MILHNIKGWDELPQHVRDNFEKSFQSNPKAEQLRQVAQNAERLGQYIIALDAAKKLDEARIRAQYKIMNNQEQEVEKVTLLQMGLSHEQLDKINVLTIAMYMACDMIEFFAIDVNEILKKQDPTASLEMFDPIRKIGREARANLSYLWKNTSMFDTEVFNDNSDNMREMLVNKAKKVYKKYAAHVANKEAGKASKDGKELV